MGNSLCSNVTRKTPVIHTVYKEVIRVKFQLKVSKFLLVSTKSFIQQVNGRK